MSFYKTVGRVVQRCFPFASQSLGSLLSDKSPQHRLVGNLAEVGSLDVGLDSLQRAAKSFFGGGVDHFALCYDKSISQKAGSGLGVYTLTGASSGDQA